MVEEILNNTTPYGKIWASHEGSLHSSTLSGYPVYSGVVKLFCCFPRNECICYHFILDIVHFCFKFKRLKDYIMVRYNIHVEMKIIKTRKMFKSFSISSREV